jgi:hypothetical protein
MNWSLNFDEPKLPKQKAPPTGPSYDDSEERMSPLGWLLESFITVGCIIRFEVPKLGNTLLVWCGLLVAALIFLFAWHTWALFYYALWAHTWDHMRPTPEEVLEEVAECLYGLLTLMLMVAVWHFWHWPLSAIVLVVLAALYLVATWDFVSRD